MFPVVMFPAAAAARCLSRNQGYNSAGGGGTGNGCFYFLTSTSLHNADSAVEQVAVVRFRHRVALRLEIRGVASWDRPASGCSRIFGAV